MLKVGTFVCHPVHVARPLKSIARRQSFATPHASKSQPPSTSALPLITDINEGNGPIAKSGSLIRCHYEGRLGSKESGAVIFDTSKGKQPFVFVLGEGSVIQGWEIGIQGMREGGIRRLIVPPSLAYGDRGIRSESEKGHYVIPPNAELKFDIELLDTDSPLFRLQWAGQRSLERATWWLCELFRGPG